MVIQVAQGSMPRLEMGRFVVTRLQFSAKVGRKNRTVFQKGDLDRGVSRKDSGGHGAFLRKNPAKDSTLSDRLKCCLAKRLFRFAHDKAHHGLVGFTISAVAMVTKVWMWIVHDSEQSRIDHSILRVEKQRLCCVELICKLNSYKFVA